MANANGLAISVPRASMTDGQLGNLRALVRSKESLIRKSLGTDSLRIETDDERISFPWFPATENAAEIYSPFVSALCDTARKLQRVNTKEERTVSNEKYAYRCFLLRIGLIGDRYKATRRALLANMDGSAAFRTPKAKEATA